MIRGCPPQSHVGDAGAGAGAAAIGSDVHTAAGAASQNLALQAAVQGLGTAVIGAFDDGAVGRALRLPPGEPPIALMPAGRPA